MTRPHSRRRRCAVHCFCAALLLLLCGFASAAEKLPSGEYAHRFEFKPQGAVKSVSVAGDFNGWSKDATPLTLGNDGTFASTVALSEGPHYYNFVVDGDKSIPD